MTEEGDEEENDYYQDDDGEWELHDSAPTPRSETEEDFTTIQRSVSDSLSAYDSLIRTPRSLSRFRSAGHHPARSGRWNAPKIDLNSSPRNSSPNEASFSRAQTSPSLITRLSSSPFRATFLRKRIPAKPLHPSPLDSFEDKEEDNVPDSIVAEAEIVINAAENFLRSIPASIQTFERVLLELDSTLEEGGSQGADRDLLMQKKQTIGDRIQHCWTAEVEISKVKTWLRDQISNRTIVPNLFRANIQRLSNMIEIAQKNLTSPTDEVLVVTVEGTGPLDAVEEIDKVCVLVSVVNSATGMFLKKSRTLRYPA